MAAAKEEATRGEEVKRELKSKPAPPQVSQAEAGLTDLTKKAPVLGIRPARIKTDITMVVTKRHSHLIHELPPKPTAVIAPKPTPRELREVTAKGTELVEPKVTVQGKAVELKPRIPKVEIREASKLSEARVLVGQPPKELLRVTPRFPRLAAPKPTEAPSVRRVLELDLRLPPQPRIPKPIEEREIAEELVTPAGIVEPKPVEVPEESIFIPPFLETLSSVARPLGRPVCLVVPKREGDPFVHAVATICREIYRIVKGGKPTPRWISKGLKDEIERYLKAEDMVFVIDDSKCELLPDFSKIQYAEELFKRVNMDLILDRLSELFSQSFGFIIFHVSKWADRFAKMLEDKVGAYVHVVRVPPPAQELRAEEFLAKVFWGFVEGRGDTFDEIFGQCEGRFFDVELVKAEGDVEIIHWLKIDESAGREHEAMKVIVVECLAKELGAVSRDDIKRMLRDRRIRTECELGGGKRADICVEGPEGRRFVEIETFYGTGNPVMKLDKETLRKYMERGVRRVDVALLTGLHALLYVRELVKLRELYRKEHGLEVNFYIPNVKDRRLVPLGEVLRQLREAMSSQEQAGGFTEDYTNTSRKRSASSTPDL